MAGRIGAGISLAGMYHEDWQYPFFISGDVSHEDIGKAVTLDTSKANTVKLAGDGDPVLGRLEVYEDRVQEGIKVATVNLAGGMKLPVKEGETVNIGDAVIGAGSGEVRSVIPTGAEADDVIPTDNIVVEVGSGFCVVVKK